MEHFFLTLFAGLAIWFAVSWRVSSGRLTALQSRVQTVRRDLCAESVCPKCPLYMAGTAECKRGVVAGPCSVKEMADCPLGYWRPSPTSP